MTQTSDAMRREIASAYLTVIASHRAALRADPLARNDGANP